MSMGQKLGEESQLWGLSFFKFLTTHVLPSICLLILFPCSFHSTSSEMTFYTFFLILNLEHFLPSSHSQLMTFLLIAFEKIATLQSLSYGFYHQFYLFAPKSSTLPPCQSEWNHWEPISANYFHEIPSPLVQTRTLFLQLSMVSFKASSPPHTPILFSNSYHSRERNALFPPLIVAVLIFLLFAKQNIATIKSFASLSWSSLFQSNLHLT